MPRQRTWRALKIHNSETYFAIRPWQHTHDEFILYKSGVEKGYNSIIDKKIGEKSHKIIYNDKSIIQIECSEKELNTFDTISLQFDMHNYFDTEQHLHNLMVNIRAVQTFRIISSQPKC